MWLESPYYEDEEETVADERVNENEAREGRGEGEKAVRS